MDDEVPLGTAELLERRRHDVDVHPRCGRDHVRPARMVGVVAEETLGGVSELVLLAERTARSLGDMRVVFTKGRGTAYQVAVHRDVGPALEPRNGVGGHDYLPHDLVHFVVETEAGIARGVFGELAAGGTGIFWPADPAERRAVMRRRKKTGPYPSAEVERDHERSEKLLRIAFGEWERRRGLSGRHRAYTVDDPATLDRLVAALDDYAETWRALPVGGSLTVTW